MVIFCSALYSFYSRTALSALPAAEAPQPALESMCTARLA